MVRASGSRQGERVGGGLSGYLNDLLATRAVPAGDLTTISCPTPFDAHYPPANTARFLSPPNVFIRFLSPSDHQRTREWWGRELGVGGDESGAESWSSVGWSRMTHTLRCAGGGWCR